MTLYRETEKILARLFDRTRSFKIWKRKRHERIVE